MPRRTTTIALLCVALTAASPAWAQKAKTPKSKAPAGQSSTPSFDDLADDLQQTQSVPAAPASPDALPPPRPPKPPAYDELPELPPSATPPQQRPPPPPISPPITAPLPPQIPGEPSKVLVMDLSPEQGADARSVAALTALVADGARRLNAYQVLAMRDLYNLPLKTQGCIGSSCLVDSFGPEYLVEGSVGVRGNQFVLNLKLTDRKIPIVVSRAMRPLPNDPKGRADTAALAVAELFAPLRPPGAAIPGPAPGAQFEPPPSAADVSAMAPQAPPRAAPSRLRYKMWWILSYAGGGALIAGGAITHSMADGIASDYGGGRYRTTADQSDAEGTFSTYKDLTISQYTVGSVLLATGLVLMIVDLATAPAAGAPAAPGGTAPAAFTWGW